MKTISCFGMLILLCCCVGACEDENYTVWNVDLGVLPVSINIKNNAILFYDTVIISWEDNSVFKDNVAYQIIDNTKQTEDKEHILRGFLNQKSITLKNLNPNQAFNLQIFSQRSSSKNASAKAYLNFTTVHDTIQLLTPTPNQSVEQDPSFTWNLNHIFFTTKTFQYVVCIDTLASFSSKQISTSALNQITTNIQPKNNQTYFWKVGIVYDNYPDTFFSRTSTFVGKNSSPSLPILLTPTNQQSITNPITFTWSRSVDPEETPVFYAIQVKDPNNNSVFSKNNVTDTFITTSFTLADNTQYTWTVAATDQAGNSSLSSPLTFIRKNSSPSLPILLTPTNQQSITNPITFTWSRSVDPEETPVFYAIQVKDPNNNSVFSKNNVTDTFITASFTLADNTQYTWTVAATDQAGNSSLSSPLTFIRKNSSPSLPILLTPTNQQSITNPITFTWSRSVDPEKTPVFYAIQVKDPNDNSVFSKNNVTDTFITASFTLADNTQYTWTVTATDQTGNSSLSSPLTFTSVATPYLRTDTNSLSFSSNSSSPKSITITSNIDWTVTDIPAWVNVSPLSGNGDNALQINVTNLVDSTERSASIRITNQKDVNDVTINIQQQLSVCESGRQTDSLALVDLYNSTGGTSWTDNTNWLSNQPINTWYGILTVTIAGCLRVSQINLTENNLDGNIPTQIGNLSMLTQLILSENNLDGNIPTQIDNLSMLTYLNLSRNNLDGNIPTQIGNLSMLTHLYLSSNNLDGNIPTQTGNLSMLTHLYLSSNNLDGNIPTQIGNLSMLTQLNLSRNNLDGNIPTQIGNLSMLTHLYLSSNNLDGNIPNEVGNMNNLFLLFLFKNQLSGNIPTQIGNLSMLSILSLSENNLDGNIPTQISNLSQLTRLNLSENNLDGNIPTQISNLSQLTSLNLSENNLDGNIPTQISNLSQLTSLILSRNNLDGNIPTQIGNLSNLTSLWLFENQLSGNIPTEIGNLSQLTSLYLHKNNLDGNIPTQIGNLSQLTYLHLSRNNLDGNIPTQIGNLSQLISLSLSSNNLDGNIPTQIGNLSQLIILSLSENNLDGNIPTQIGNFSQLTSLILSENNLDGNIPTQIGNLSQLTYLHLESNNLDGNIPNAICTRHANGQYRQFDTFNNPSLTPCP